MLTSIVQEVFVKVHLKKDRDRYYSTRRNYGGLLLTMVRHQCIDAIRKDGTRRKGPG